MSANAKKDLKVMVLSAPILMNASTLMNVTTYAKMKSEGEVAHVIQDTKALVGATAKILMNVRKIMEAATCMQNV